MDKLAISARLEELRKKYREATNPIDRKIIAIRGKLLRRSLEIMENKEPPQKHLLE
jgi:hypothetical protein